MREKSHNHFYFAHILTHAHTAHSLIDAHICPFSYSLERENPAVLVGGVVDSDDIELVCRGEGVVARKPGRDCH